MVLRGTSTLRCDPEYFQKQHLADAMHVRDKADEFQTLRDLRIGVDASAFYPSIQEFYDSGELPFYRVGDVDGMVEVERATKIPAKLCDEFPTLKRVRRGDILFTKGGAIDRVGYVIKEGAVSRDLIFLKTSRLPESMRLWLFTYFRTAFFSRMLLRSSSQTAQPHLTLLLVRELPILLASDRLRAAVASPVIDAYHHADQANNLLRRTEDALLEALGLEDWTPPEPLSYNATLTDIMGVKRLDAQFHRPKFKELQAVHENRFELQYLHGVVLKGRTVPYSETGTVPIIRSGDLTDIDIDDAAMLHADASEPIFLLKKGDVLISSIGFGSIGKVQVFDKEGRYGTVSEVTVVRQGKLNPFYIMAYLRSEAGQLQIDRYITGATGQLHLYPRDVEKFFIPILPADKQIEFERIYNSARQLKTLSRQLLEATKRAVEIAIEDGEAAAMTFLDQAEGAS